MKKLLLWAVVASLLVAAVVTVVSALQTPTYEASAKVLVGQERAERLQGLAPTLALTIDTTPVAEGTIRRLGLEMSPSELLSNLTTESVETSQFIELSYTDTDPERATQIVNTVGQVSSERISVKSEANDTRATLYDKASVPETPASPKPLRNGLIALVAGPAVSSAALFAVRRGWLPLGGTG